MHRRTENPHVLFFAKAKYHQLLHLWFISLWSTEGLQRQCIRRHCQLLCLLSFSPQWNREESPAKSSGAGRLSKWCLWNRVSPRPFHKCPSTSIILHDLHLRSSSVHFQDLSFYPWWLLAPTTMIHTRTVESDASICQTYGPANSVWRRVWLNTHTSC